MVCWLAGLLEYDFRSSVLSRFHQAIVVICAAENLTTPHQSITLGRYVALRSGL